jgi:hypothetical protein
MTHRSLSRRAVFAGGSAGLACLSFPAQAFDIVPDSRLHAQKTRIVTVGEGKYRMSWNIWDIRKAAYGGDGKIVWSFSQRSNPVPAGRTAAEAWFVRQLKGVIQALGGEQPTRVLASMEMAGSTVEVDGPPFTADFNIMFKSREPMIGNIYVMKVSQGKGRLIVFLLSEEDRLPNKASADFAKLWGRRLSDMHPNESP